MLQFTRSLVAVCVLTVLGSAALAQEMVDNPRYQSWAKFKPGTTVTLLTVHETEVGDGKMTKFEMTITYKLTDLTAEKAVVETTITSPPPADATAELKALWNAKPRTTKTESPAKVKKEDVKGPELVPPGLEKMEKKVLADEEVTVAGKTYKCKVYDIKGELKGTNISSRFWECPQLPISMVKIEQQMSGAMKGTSMTTVTAVDLR